MKNLNIKLILLYIVFMMGLKANAQMVSKQDSLTYSKELSLDRATKVKFIQENDPASYEKLLKNINLDMAKYGRISDSLLNLAKKIVMEKTGDSDLIYSWELLKPTEKGQMGNIDMDLYNRVKALLEEAKRADFNQQDNVKNVINADFLEFLKNNPDLSPFKVKEEQKKSKLFGKSR